MASSLRLPGSLRSTPSRLFSDAAEDSLRLRLLMLLTVVWVALAVNWVTASQWLPLGASAMAAAGHWVSWRQRRSRLGLRTAAVAVAIVAVALLGREDIASAPAGDRLPVAEYLVLINALASFAIRTRGGLYAQLALSGATLYLVSERAFDPAFVGFLIVFLGLFLTFFAMAYLEDQIKVARVHWPEGQLGRFWFWLGTVGGGLLVCSALAFSLLPADYRGNTGVRREGVVPFLGDATGPLSQMGLNPRSPEEESDASAGSSLIGSGEAGEQGLREFGIAGGDDLELEETSGDPQDVVMHVRSGVTGYWRGRLFDVFDGQTWRRSGDAVVGGSLPYRSSYYWQTYFVNMDQSGALFVGYNPIRVALPSKAVSLTPGTAYSVLSQQPRLNEVSVRGDRAARAGPNHLSLPPDSEELRDLAQRVTGNAQSPFGKMWRIVSYLRQNHGFDASAADQLQLSTSVEEFLVDGTQGTGLDFATATVLLARAVDVPARLAAGYLPGRFDRFSGTHKVRARHAQAWAEVHLENNGWVAFDATPRPELEVYQDSDLSALPGGAYILQTRLGAGLYYMLYSGASAAAGRIGESLEGRGRAVQASGALVAAAVVAAAALWAVRRGRRERREERPYARLPGESRREVMRAYARAERVLRRRGLAPRGRSETIGEYLESAAGELGGPVAELRWFAQAVWTAAYDPIGPDEDLAREAAERASRLGRVAAGSG